MFNVRLPGDHMYEKWLMMSLMVSYLDCPFYHEMCWMRSGTESSYRRSVSYLLLKHTLVTYRLPLAVLLKLIVSQFHSCNPCIGVSIWACGSSFNYARTVGISNMSMK